MSLICPPGDFISPDLPIEEAGPVLNLSDEKGQEPANARMKAAMVAEATSETVTRAPRPLRFFNSASMSRYPLPNPSLRKQGGEK